MYNPREILAVISNKSTESAVQQYANCGPQNFLNDTPNENYLERFSCAFCLMSHVLCVFSQTVDHALRKGFPLLTRRQ